MCQVPKRLIYILALSKHFLQRTGELKKLIYFFYIFQNRFFLLFVAPSSFNLILTITFSILLTVYRNFTNKLFIIAKKSCQRHLAGRPRYCLRKSGKYIIPAALARSYNKANFRPLRRAWKKLPAFPFLEQYHGPISAIPRVERRSLIRAILLPPARR